eukprot:10889653-Alexandrium_andersonii.AAC.1
MRASVLLHEPACQHRDRFWGRLVHTPTAADSLERCGIFCRDGGVQMEAHRPAPRLLSCVPARLGAPWRSSAGTLLA